MFFLIYKKNVKTFLTSMVVAYMRSLITEFCNLVIKRRQA